MTISNEMTGASMLVYDIPKDAGYALPNGKWRKIANPSYRLRGCATRINLSVWVVPDAGIESANRVIDRLRKCPQVDVDIVRFAEGEREKCIRMARRGLVREAKRIRKYIDKAIAKSQKKLDEAVRSMSVGGVNEAIAYRKSAIQRARRELLAAREASIAFDLLGSLQELHDSVISTLKAADATKFGEAEERSVVEEQRKQRQAAQSQP